MINLIDKSQCCGCTACASICGHDAISMVPDVLGFKYPMIDKDKCIECGLCDKVCAFNNHYDISDRVDSPQAYAARHIDIDEVLKSRSGGAFVCISDYVLSKGGHVYGVGYKDHFVVTHKRASSVIERDEFRGSKYVQSDLDGIFIQIKQDLKNGDWVLFSGTGCQVAGLKSFIPQILREKLIMVDIVCHGVPSPYVWRDYINDIEKEHNSVIKSVDFRNKIDFGWMSHKETYLLENGKKVTKDNFTYLFYEEIMLRPSCKSCHFTNFNRPGDFTIADFWGYENTDKQINSDNRGVSLLICNTQKAFEIFPHIKANLNTISAKLENCLQPNLLKPTEFHKDYLKFPHDYATRGLDYVMKKYGNTSFLYKIKNAAKRVIAIPKFVLSRTLRVLKLR